MTDAQQNRRDGLYFVVLGCAVFLLIGAALERAAPVSTQDFRVVYYAARCLLDHHDPYNVSDLDHTYSVDGGETEHDTPMIRETERHDIYFPTAFPITAPFALLPFGLAQIFWSAFTAASLILSAILMWSVGAKSSSTLSGGLVGLSLANSVFFIAIGNPGGITVGLCVIAVWCFLQERFEIGGVLALSIALLLKPHVAGLIWLYLLFADGPKRKRALQVLALVFVSSVASVLWVNQVAPNWFHELRSIMQMYSARGGINDPGPTSKGGRGIGMLISLQAPLSFLWDNPTFYNLTTYLICGALLAIWAWKAWRSRFPAEDVWFAIAPIAVLSILPVYHRLGDSKLLLLTVPAAAALWSKHDALGRCALALSCAGFLLTGETQWAVFLGVLGHYPGIMGGLRGTFLRDFQVFSVPFVLLLSCIFYLYVYVRHAGDKDASSNTQSFDL